MPTVQSRIESLGGIASLRELIRFGHDRGYILLLAEYGRITRVRHGWYALHGNDAVVVEAWRVGGRLACVSALAYYGLCRAPDRLHVAVAANASRLRMTERSVVHWSRRPLNGDRAAVSLGEAVRQASRCRQVTRDSL